jgi:hypothetical protein
MTMRRRSAVALVMVAVAVSLPSAATAGWKGAGSGSAYARAKTMPGGNTPTASVSNRSVTVSWTAPSGGAPATGYIVKRFDGSGSPQTIGANCSGTIGGTSCTENAVPAGSWRYSVTPVNANWRGAESAQSPAVSVGSPTLSLDSATVTSLPASLTGQVTNFIGGQTVTFRLDDATSGTVLSGSINPSPVPDDGTASVSVTIPAGTSNGVHEVFAIGSKGDTASTSFSVAASTVETSAWDLRDASSGAETDASDPLSFAKDGRTYTSKGFTSDFSEKRYLDFDYGAPLGQGDLSTSSVSFALRVADPSVDGTACFYFDVRRVSTGALIGTHGSDKEPVGCVTSKTEEAFSTALPEVTTSDVANDLRIRVYFTESLGLTESLAQPVEVDEATVSGTAEPALPFTLYETQLTDAADGVEANTAWPLVSNDGTAYTSASTWPKAFDKSSYLKLSFPAYVPSGATISSVTFNHTYRSNGGGTTCYYFDVLADSKVIDTHGSADKPVSCNESSSKDVTDTVSLPEVKTVSEANSLAIQLYVQNSSSEKSDHDLATVTITYAP